MLPFFLSLGVFLFTPCLALAAADSCPPLSPPSPKAGGGSHYYIDPDGLTVGGCSKENPCREIRQVIDKLGPGDVVHVADGRYMGFDVVLKRGTAEKPIAFVATGKDVSILKAHDRDRNANREPIFLQNCEHVIVDGLNVYNSLRHGILIQDSKFITVRNGTYKGGTESGVFLLRSQDVILENNSFIGAVKGHGVKIEENSQRPTIRFNRIRDNFGTGIFAIGGRLSGIRLEGNVISGSGKGAGAAINLTDTHDSLVISNVLFQNLSGAIALYGGSSNVKVVGNTILQDREARHDVTITNSTGAMLIRDNILFHQMDWKSGISYESKTDQKNTDSDYNAVDRVGLGEKGVTLAEWRAGNPQSESHSLALGDIKKLFVNPAKNDYALAVGSPLRGKGILVPEAARDVNGKCRPSPPSIGAYE